MKKIVSLCFCMFTLLTVQALEIQTTVLPDGDVGQSYNAVLSATNGTPPYSWIWYPDDPSGYGLTMSSNGVLSGIPTQAVSNTVTIAVQDNFGNFTFADFELVIFDDRDGDGMNDAWELTIIDDNPADGIATIYDVLRDDNYDADLFLNIEEYLLGYNPVVVDGDPLDTIGEGLELMKRASTSDVDTVYFDLIDRCFETVVTNESTNYAARVYRAVSRLVNLVNNDELKDLIADFGAGLSFDFMLNGNIDVFNGPLPDVSIDVICSNLLPAVNASLADIESIPENWAGVVEISTNYFSVDETVYADIGDITAGRAALKLFRSFLLTCKAQTLNMEYENLLLPIDAPITSIAIDGGTNDWSEVPAQLIGELDSGIDFVKGARSGSSLYFLMGLRDSGNEFGGVEAGILLGRDSEAYVDCYPMGGYTNIWFSETETNTTDISWVYTNHLLEVEIPVPAGVAISNACITDVVVGYGMIYEPYGYLPTGEDYIEMPFSMPASTPFEAYPDFLESVRSESDLAMAKVNMKQAIDLCQQADGMIKARTDILMHFIEYDPTNEVERVESFEYLQDAEQSLVGAKHFIFTNDVGAAVFEETIHWGALYQSNYLTRAMLPEFWQIIGQPMLDTMPDPTFGGVLPDMTQAKLTACFQKGGDRGLDWDGDGIPNGWEYFHGGNPTNLQALLDDDGDGCSNADEYLAGTNPTNSESCFKAEFEVDPFQMVIRWQAADDRVYDILWSPSLGQRFQYMKTGITASQSTYADSAHHTASFDFEHMMAYTATVHRATSSGFFRVVAHMPGPNDLDADGLPDDWEGSHFGNFSATAGYDYDGDSQNNIEEFIAGTDPTDALSFFGITQAHQENEGFVVEWFSIPERNYSVQWAPELGAQFQTLESGLRFPQSSYTDTVHGVESKGYYKAHVEPIGSIE